MSSTSTVGAAFFSLLLLGCGRSATSDGAPAVPTPIEDAFVAADVSSGDTLRPEDISASDTSRGPDTWSGPRCDDGQPALGFSSGPYGAHRGEVAADFEITEPDETVWRFSDRFGGCESVVVLVDAIPVSDLDHRSIWEVPGAVERLVAASRLDVHYVFVSNGADADAAAARVTALQAQVQTVLAALDPGVRERWRTHLHVSRLRAQDMAGWLGAALTSHLRTGLAIDRDQRIHGVGSLADVRRFDQDLQDAGAWPWQSDLGYGAHEAAYLAADHDASVDLAATSDVAVTLFDGEVLERQAEVDVALPADVAAFDTLWIEVIQACPDPDALEFESCGAWDYLAQLYVRDDAADGGPVEREIARFITSYGRETHWIVDASLALPLLRAGSSRHFRWEFAPEWNPQPTRTTLTLHFADRHRGIHPTTLVPLFTGGAFGAGYNDRAPVVVDIPEGAHHVELWALITGHGSGTAQCAEFCPHQHVFLVDGTWHLTAFAEAGTEDGCVAHIADGMVPNQGGTWWFGRGGWCPGAAVTPWVVDLSSEVTPGAPVTIGYEGQLAGTDPPDGAGEIVLSSYLLIWE